MKRNHLFLTLTLLTALALIAGCGMDQSPISSGEPTLTQTEDGRTFLSFSPQAARRAKLAQIPAEGKTVSQWFGSAGGSLMVEDLNRLDPQDDLRVTFTVPQGALGSPTAEAASLDDAALVDTSLEPIVRITMTVYGNNLEELIVEFGPDGLTFAPHSSLALELGDDRVHTPLDEIQAWHQHGDGKVELAIFMVRETDTGVLIDVDVPGFSRYCTGGGCAPKPIVP